MTGSSQKSATIGLAFVLLLTLTTCRAVDPTSTGVAEDGAQPATASEMAAVDTSNMTSKERAEEALRNVPGKLVDRLTVFEQRMDQLPEQVSDYFAFDEDKAIKVKEGGFEFQDGTMDYIVSDWWPRVSGEAARQARAEEARIAREEEERQQQIAASPQGIDFSQATPLNPTGVSQGNQFTIAPAYTAGAGQTQLAANPASAIFNRPTVNKLVPGGIEGIGRFFDQNGYRLESIRRGALVPPVFARTLPRDMNNSVPANKDVFIRLLLPLVLKANAEVAMERAIILNSGYSGTIPQAPVEVQAIAAKYDIQSNTTNLLQRVDVLPPSLILAQAGLESGWGTSRYVQQGNALFGQRVWDANQPGMTPNARDTDATHRVRTFTTLEESIHSYLRNLNMNNAYLELRRTRASYRAAGRPVTALELIPRLQYYSEDPAYYLGTLNSIVSYSRLTDFDRAALSNGQPMNLFL